MEDNIFQSFIVDSYGYILFLGVAILLLFQKDKRALHVFLSVLILFGGLRGGIGIDFINYNKWYNTTINDNNLEIGYVGIMNVFAYFNLSIYHIQFLFFTVTLLFISLALNKYSINLKYAWFFYLIFPYFFLYSFIFMRQYFVMAIVFWSFQFLLKNKFWQYAISILIGSLFHYSCLLAGLLVFALFYISKRVNRKQILFLLLVSLPFAFINWFQFFGNFFEDTKYEGYFLAKNIIPVNYIKLVLFNFEALFILYFYDEFIKLKPTNKYFIVIVIFAFIFANIFASVKHLFRFSLYFKFFELIVLAEIAYLNRKRIFVLPLIAFYGLSLFFNGLWFDYKMPEKHTKLAPYKNILFNR
ncbi:EpsG family protein [Flavobacterium sp.]|uniref:EpsG family protein n=1 Tax=Flavobacterium sp. TaxID=239 RepID=UPI0037BF89CB